jgi:hypothetical protein
MEFHALANAFPLLEGEEFDQLVADIEKSGQLHPVVRYEGKILDGRNRYNACQRLGIPHRETEFRGEDPVAFVVSENLARRHMSPAQLAVAAEKLATAAQGRPRTKGPDGTEAEHATTIDEAAKLTGASGTSVKRVRRVRKEADPAVVAAMDAGEITPTAAEALASRSAEEQQAAVAAGPRAAAAKANQVQRAQRNGSAVSRRTDPKVVMSRQMDLPDLRMVQDVAADWSERSELIHELDGERVTEFLKNLRASRAATTKLIELVEKETSQAAAAARIKEAEAAEVAAKAEAPGAGTEDSKVTSLADVKAKKSAASGASGKAAAPSLATKTIAARKAPARAAAPAKKATAPVKAETESKAGTASEAKATAPVVPAADFKAPVTKDDSSA